MVVERHWMIGWRKNDGSGHQIFGWSTGKIFRARLPLRHGQVTCLLYEPGKLFVRHVSFVYPEAIHIHAVDGARINRSVHANFIDGRWIHCAHGKLTARDPCHFMG
jgi:hypothetical protein